VLKFSKFVIKHRIFIVVLAFILIIPSLVGIILTRQNYDVLSYMPGDLNSRRGEELLKEKFKLSGLGLIIVNNKELWEVMDLKSKIEAVHGVDKVLWLDEFEDITIPVEFMTDEVRENFFSGDSTILQVQFEENARSKATSEAVKEIRKIIDSKTLFGGEPVIISDLQEITSKELVYYMIIALVSIYLILAASMTSFIEPLLFLVSVGIAIVFNMGTNVIKGEISFVTASIAAVMQLGISMDYSIFLLHRYEEEKLKYPSPQEAMASALSKTGTAVAASALTTIAGFAALMVMKNGLGRDLGFVLGKGIIMSMLVNVTVLPCLILIFGKYADKRRHKPILPTLKKSSKWMVKYRWIFLVIILIVSVPSFLGQKNLKLYYANEHYLPETSRAVIDTKKSAEILGTSEIVYVITEDEGRIKEKELMEKIKRIPAVESVLGLSEQLDMAIPESFIPDEVADRFINGNYRYFQVMLSTSSDDPDTFSAIDKMRELAQDTFNEYYVTGSAPLSRDLAGLVDMDSRNVAIISVGLIAIILAFSFMSLSIPFILILIIELAIWINLSIPYFQGNTVSSVTSIVIGAIQLGATVDYAILFTTRYRENLGLIPNKKEALRQTIEDTGRTILTSALTMLSATLGIALIASIKTTGELTMMIGRGAIISMVTIFLGLPPMLLIFDRLIGWTTKNWVKTTVKGGNFSEKKNI
jgi:predicted RND superfamily exporter protein